MHSQPSSYTAQQGPECPRPAAVLLQLSDQRRWVHRCCRSGGLRGPGRCVALPPSQEGSPEAGCCSPGWRWAEDQLPHQDLREVHKPWQTDSGSSFYFLFLGVQFTPGSVSPPLAFREALSLLASSLCSSRLQQEQLQEAGMTGKVGVWGFLWAWSGFLAANS